MPAQLNALCQIPRLYLAWNTVKAKGSAGGVDGISIIEFENEKRKLIPKLAEELKAGTWKPQPYMEIEVAKTKNPDEIRKLGMTAIRDRHRWLFAIGTIFVNSFLMTRYISNKESIKGHVILLIPCSTMDMPFSMPESGRLFSLLI